MYFIPLFTYVDWWLGMSQLTEIRNSQKHSFTNLFPKQQSHSNPQTFVLSFIVRVPHPPSHSKTRGGGGL